MASMKTVAMVSVSVVMGRLWRMMLLGTVDVESRSVELPISRWDGLNISKLLDLHIVAVYFYINHNFITFEFLIIFCLQVMRNRVQPSQGCGIAVLGPVKGVVHDNILFQGHRDNRKALLHMDPGNESCVLRNNSILRHDDR